MKHYAVVVLDWGKWEIVYAGKTPFITTYKHIAEQHLKYCQENWPNEKYQIVEFNVKEM